MTGSRLKANIEAAFLTLRSLAPLEGDLERAAALVAGALLAGRKLLVHTLCESVEARLREKGRALA